MQRPLAKSLAILNFLVIGIGAATWLTCRAPQAPQPSAAPAPTSAGDSAVQQIPMTRSVTPSLLGVPHLATREAIAECLNKSSGVTDGACDASKEIPEVKRRIRQNDEYFAASKAAVAVAEVSADVIVDEYVQACLRTDGAAEQGAAAVPARGKDDPATIACVLKALSEKSLPK